MSNEALYDVNAPQANALRSALKGVSLLGFDTTGWAEGNHHIGEKPAFVGIQLVGPPFSRQNLYTLNFDSASGQFTIGSLVSSEGYTGRDLQDDTSRDNVNLLGDFQPDTFRIVGGTSGTAYRLNYLGKTSGDQELAGVDGSGNRYLFTDRTYTANQPITLINSTSDPYPVCFTSGTRILTARGEVAVEALHVGDLVVTASGEERPVRWISHRETHCRHHSVPRDVMPVRIAAGAFGENRPARPLTVSPGHAICIAMPEEVLLPAIVLVNGTTITQQAVETITYWHIELDSHDLLIAEGQPAESYLDMGNRDFFSDSDIVALQAAPEGNAASRTHADFCRPYHNSGDVLDAARALVQARAELLGWGQGAGQPPAVEAA